MTDEPDDEIAIHRIASQHFERTIRAISALTVAIETGGDATLRDVTEGLTDLRKAMQTLFDERKRTDNVLLREGTDGRPTDFDLDDARTDLQRRLARLADTVEAPEIPDGTG